MKRNCPICKNEIEYKSIDSLRCAERRKSSCNDCRSKKISEKRKGIKFSENHRNNLSKSHLGKKLSENHKNNIGKSGRGRKVSEESRIRYSKSKMGDKNPSKRQDVKDKIRASILNLYKENPEIKNRISKSLSEFFKKSDKYVSEENLNDYLNYRKVIENQTRRNKKELIENWNGLDYYDNEYIKDNFNLDYNSNLYPTIDHKISILTGFKNQYPPEIISSIENLCLTKREINNKKGFKDEYEFKLK